MERALVPLVESANRTPEASVETATGRIDSMGGWMVGPDVTCEVSAWEEYPEQAKPGDYTRSVIPALEKLGSYR